MLDRPALDQRRGAGGLEAQHPGQPGGLAEPAVLPVALPVGGDVAGVADRQDVVVGGVAQAVDDLEGAGLLPLDPVGVDRVDQGDRVPVAEGAYQLQGLVEVALDLDHPGAVDEGLGQLAEGDLAGGDDYQRLESGPGGVGGRRGRGVAGRGADDRLLALLPGLGDGQGHAPVLEGAGRVAAFKLEVEFQAEAGADGDRGDERGVALQQGDHRAALGDRQVGPVTVDDTAVTAQFHVSISPGKRAAPAFSCRRPAAS
ncbi:MAG: hypothetical protein BWY73_00877 [candidate division TA06 bacterium ADurb.Bin417]|uniref:Uncharacterized protein n=1 Tax=candidate division TA06 bacterium ADurb.Bin417 TaxID=1852828 RepID=A0A1V5MGN4_UNCT6|nr:MAG: hypothetical protein BWY73_00877 [candidate division TA06 bacterium ADurb.Bin417]